MQTNTNERRVKNACTCTICGAPADRLDHVFQCQANPNHYADLVTGLFDDHTYPEREDVPVEVETDPATNHDFRRYLEGLRHDPNDNVRNVK